MLSFAPIADVAVSEVAIDLIGEGAFDMDIILAATGVTDELWVCQSASEIASDRKWRPSG